MFILSGPKNIHKDQGYILVIVLWMALLLSIIGWGILREFRNERALSAAQAAHLQAQLYADGAIQAAILSFLDSSAPTHFRINGEQQKLNIGDATVDVRVTSEVGKINLNLAPREFLQKIFMAKGLAVGDSVTLVDNIISWRTVYANPADDFTVVRYVNAGRRYGPRHNSFHTISELKLVLGMNPDLFGKVASLFTVYTNSQNIDLGLASNDVLQALASTDNKFAEAQLSARANNEAQMVDRQPTPGEVLCIAAQPELKTLAVTRVAYIRLQPNGPIPYQVLGWE